MRILFVGEKWLGSGAGACSRALRKLGHEVIDLDEQVFLPQWRGTLLKGFRKLLMPLIAQAFNKEALRIARWFEPQILFAFKGSLLKRGTVAAVRHAGAWAVNYYPDNSLWGHGPWLPKAIGEYDVVFFTKPFWAADVQRRVTLQRTVYLPHGYDPCVHRMWEISPADEARYGHDVAYIGNYHPHKLAWLEGLVASLPDLDLAIWGGGWRGAAMSQRLRRCVTGIAPHGVAYAKVIRASKICLGINFGATAGASQGDQTSTRTFEIPACGGFMLHERTPELLELFDEDGEVACFSSVQELASKIQYYLNHPEERAKVAQAAHNRCVPAYSYDQRMMAALAWCQRHLPGGLCGRGMV